MRSIQDKQKQTQNFEEAISNVIDQYLVDGMNADQIREVLRGQVASDLRARLSEIRAQDSDLAELPPLTPDDQAKIDAAWKQHAAAKPR